MRRRQLPDPLQPSNDPRWLVVRDVYSLVVESRQLAPFANLRAVLTADREQRIAQGWTAEDIGPASAFYFAILAGARYYVGIEAQEPGTPFTWRWKRGARR